MKIYGIDTLLKNGKHRCSVNIYKSNNANPEAPHTHDFVELVYILGGEGTHTINNVDYRVSRGDMLFINYKQVHSFNTPNEMTIANILLTPDFISEELVTTDNAFALLSLSAFTDFRERCDRNLSFVRFEGNERAEIEMLIHRMVKECEQDNIGGETILRSCFTMMLTYLFRKLSEVTSKENVTYEENCIFEYIREHLSEPITLEGLAKQTFYNPSYFSRMFKEKCGMTLTSYLRKSRLERACTLLADESISISDIASLAGFGTASDFHKKFKDAYGMTPSKWRKGNAKGKK